MFAYRSSHVAHTQYTYAIRSTHFIHILYMPLSAVFVIRLNKNKMVKPNAENELKLERKEKFAIHLLFGGTKYSKIRLLSFLT